jgi:hypothetical protein
MKCYLRRSLSSLFAVQQNVKICFRVTTTQYSKHENTLNHEIKLECRWKNNKLDKHIEIVDTALCINHVVV